MKSYSLHGRLFAGVISKQIRLSSNSNQKDKGKKRTLTKKNAKSHKELTELTMGNCTNSPRSFKIGQWVEKPLHLSIIPHDDRHFICEWGRVRFIEEFFIVQALTYWMRVRSLCISGILGQGTADIEADSGLRNDSAMSKVCKIVCIHISLKFHGYDEIHKTSFLDDLREVLEYNTDQQVKLEFRILSFLNWDLF